MCPGNVGNLRGGGMAGGEGILFLFFFYYLNSGQGGIQIFTFISISTLFAMIK